MKPIPSASQASRTSSEVSSPRLYWFWTETIRVTDCARRSCPSEKFDGDDLLAHAGAVDVRGVDQRHPELDRAAHDAHALLAVGDDAHRPEAEPADLELSAEEKGRVQSATGSPPRSAER
jgi:hypothetical protein